MILKIVLGLIIVFNGLFAIRFFTDYFQHREEAKAEPGNPIFLAIYTCIAQVLGTFGISDFALGTIVYRKFGIVPDENLPGTLNTACTIPVAVMALSYISSIEVDILTLVVCIAAQATGSFLGPRFVAKMPAEKIRMYMGTGLIVACLMILAQKFGVIPQSGVSNGLTGIKLIIAAVLVFIFGALNNVGIGSYAPVMATIYTLGLNPAVAFPVMMGACTFSCSVGSMEFVKYGNYSRKVTMFSTIFGTLGVLFAVYVVKSLDTEMLKWVVAFVVGYTGLTMVLNEIKRRKANTVAPVAGD